ncbi:MAG: NAD(P)H-hydrate dehydratase [Nitrospirae bacterium]|nr:NAD(P)H-hydrate dehydratase [Nitrospirota bacterium]
MLKVVTAEEMQFIDRLTIEKYGIAGAVLMERAGLAVVQKINKLFFQGSRGRGQGAGVKEWTTDNGQRKTVIVLCGGGNNGGDGLVVARILHNQGKDVYVFLSSKPEDLKGDARTNYVAAVKFGVKIFPMNKFLTLNSKLLTLNSVIVDALLGTGLNKEVRPPLSDVINKINELALQVVSIDIPSGISSDTGQIMGRAVRADATVTFGLPKRGHYLYPGAEHTGKLYIEDIGFPRQLTVSDKVKINIPSKEDICKMLPPRPKYSHKGSYGHVLLIGGSKGKTGAALMAARACLRAGAGLVTIGLPETLASSFQSRVTEEMILPLPDKGNGTLSYKASETIFRFLEKRATVLAVGPGLSVDEEISRLVCLLVRETKAPIVIDADGLNAIAGETGILRKSKAPVILTPHMGEMARLLSGSRVRGQGSRGPRTPNSKLQTLNPELHTMIERDRISAALSFSKQTRAYLVLKSAPTVIATPDGRAFINPTGNPGMATAGTGDVLTGMISALLAQKSGPQDASVLGVYMHGLAGDVVAQKKGEHSLIASDIIDALPAVFRRVKD